VQYKGAPETVIATVAGEVEISFPSITAVRPLLESRAGSGRCGYQRQARVVAAVNTHGRRCRGCRLRTLTWHGVLAPAGVPKDIMRGLTR